MMGHASKQYRVALVMVFLSAVSSQFTLAQTRPDPLVELQNQILALRNEFKLRIQQTEHDQRTIQQNLKAKVEEIGQMQTTTADGYAELKTGLATIKTQIDGHEAGIAEFEQRVTAIDADLNTQFTSIDTQLKEIVARGLSAPTSGDSTQEPTAPTLEQLDIPAGQLFRAAYKFYMEEDYDTAIAGFQKYLTDYPNTELAGAAQYWIAESFNKLGEYDIALAEYETLFRQYPQDAKAADGYYGQGVALFQSGRIDEAKAAFQYVSDHFPGTIAAQKATTRLREIQ